MDCPSFKNFNIEGEYRRETYVSSNMKKVWNVQLLLVSKLLEVCRKNNLRIWADGGTLIGVVREHGYIPWDDDIDMIMFRADYDKLISIAKTEFEPPFFFQSVYTDKGYYRGHSQLRYDGTTAILPSDVFQDFHQGIFIDIFVYDEIPDQLDEGWEETLSRAWFLSQKLYHAMYPGYLIYHLNKEWIRFSSKVYCFVRGYKNVFNEFDDLFRRNNGLGFSFVCSPCFRQYDLDKITRKIEWYNETLWMPFENILMPIPSEYDKILSKQFGRDYMTPRREPSIHGGFLVLDAEKSYQEYLPPLRKGTRMNLFKQRMSKFWHLFHHSKNH